MHGWVPGPRSLRGARTLLGFPSPAAPLSTRAVLSSSEERCFFMPEPGALVLLCTMQIPALLSADVGSARPRRPAPPLRAHRPRAASGSLHWCREAGRGVSARPGSRPYSECGLEKARACFSLATLVTRGPPSPVPRVRPARIRGASGVCAATPASSSLLPAPLVSISGGKTEAQERKGGRRGLTARESGSGARAARLGGPRPRRLGLAPPRADRGRRPLPRKGGGAA